MTNQQYLDQYRARPDTGSFTEVVCSHPYHSVEQFFLPLEAFQENILGVIRGFWINEYTIVIKDVS